MEKLWKWRFDFSFPAKCFTRQNFEWKIFYIILGFGVHWSVMFIFQKKFYGLYLPVSKNIKATNMYARPQKIFSTSKHHWSPNPRRGQTQNFLFVNPQIKSLQSWLYYFNPFESQNTENNLIFFMTLLRTSESDLKFVSSHLSLSFFRLSSFFFIFIKFPKIILWNYNSRQQCEENLFIFWTFADFPFSFSFLLLPFFPVDSSNPKLNHNWIKMWNKSLRC